MDINKILDMDGNELKVGDVILFGTGSKRISRAKIISIDDFGRLELKTLKNRRVATFAEWVLLDMTNKHM